MSPDEIERTMQFLLHQQAQFAADFERHEANLDRLSEKTERVADGLIGLTGIVGQLAAAQQRTDEQVNKTAAQLEETQASLRETQASLRDTDARLSHHITVVTDMFERHLREDHGLLPS